jgi:hypothetical protein
MVFLAACVSDAPQTSLSKDEVTGFKIVRVDVSLARDAIVDWKGGALEYAESKGIKAPTGANTSGDTAAQSEYLAKADSLINSEEAKAFTRTRAAELVKSGVSQALADRIKGQRPVRVEIVLKSIVTQNPLLRVLVDNSDTLVADTTVIDAASGKPLASYPSLTVTQANRGGLMGAVLDNAIRGDSVHRMAKQYGEQVRDWLLPS